MYIDVDGSLTGKPGTNNEWIVTTNSKLLPPEHCTFSVPDWSINPEVSKLKRHSDFKLNELISIKS